MLIEPDGDITIRHVIDHLTTSYGGSRAPDEVEAAAATAHTSFGSPPIRTYLPVLVERRARRILGDNHRASVGT
ncbi:three-helix bundle dimerization domain-containing protein [Streptomyces sp. NPDC007901]|uniref:three-helix bundle dimerization domain-containing protein n=1 Tax=Streptomyces sp. NPDC007901 TaxID=3364785 RepID=UPI0036EA5440